MKTYPGMSVESIRDHNPKLPLEILITCHDDKIPWWRAFHEVNNLKFFLVNRLRIDFDRAWTSYKHSTSGAGEPITYRFIVTETDGGGE